MDKEDIFENCNKKLKNLIELGDLLWDNNWSWTVIKQDVDYAETINGSFEVGIATFVNITLFPSRLERQNVGYSYVTLPDKSVAYNFCRKMSVLSALAETMCCFGGEIPNKVNIAVQNKADNMAKPSEISSSTANITTKKEIPIIAKSTDSAKPKSPGKSSRFTPKTITDNSVQNNPAGNIHFSAVKTPPVPIPVGIIPGNIERNNSVPGRAGNKNVPFPAVPKTSPTSVVTFNPKTGPLPIVTHPTAPLQQIPSNIMAPITHDAEKSSASNANVITKKTEEELRQERKRRQREKQELFKKQMESKTINIAPAVQSDTLNEISTQDMVIAVESAVNNDNTKMKRPNSCKNVSVAKRNR